MPRKMSGRKRAGLLNWKIGRIGRVSRRHVGAQSGTGKVSSATITSGSRMVLDSSDSGIFRAVAACWLISRELTG